MGKIEVSIKRLLVGGSFYSIFDLFKFKHIPGAKIMIMAADGQNKFCPTGHPVSPPKSNGFLGTQNFKIKF